MREQLENVLREVGKVIAGKREVTEKILMALLADGHILLDDVPGVGKTTLAVALSRAVGLSFRRVQFTPDVLPSDLTGFSMYQKAGETFVYQPGVLNGTNLLLGDEINRASSKTQSALLEAMEERQVSLEGERHALPELFMVLATENPVEFHGVFPLPEAQMDRFMIRLSLGYPTAETELDIVRSHRAGRPLAKLGAVTTPEGVLDARAQVRDVHVDESLERYAVSLVQATRGDAGVRLAASPRAGINLLAMARACAYVAGRDFVNPDDIQRVFYPVMEHRVFAKESAPGASHAILSGILSQTSIPR